MRRNPVVVLTVLTLTVLVAGNPARAQGQSSTPLESSLTESVQPSLVTVTAYDAGGKVITSGGGCFVRDNVIATDYLTIKDAASIRISTSRAESITGWLFAVDQSRLLALIHADGTKAPPLLPAESSNIAASNIVPGQHAFAVAGARTGRADLLPVTISGSTDKTADDYFAVDSGGQQLPHGSPIINANGNIAGIVTAVENAGPGYSYAVPARALSKLIYQSVNDVAITRQLEPKSDEQAAQASNSDFVKMDYEGVRVGQVIRHVDPAYPALAKAAGIGGPAVVEIAIDEAGYVRKARPLQGDPLLLDAAAAAAMGWRYAPSTRNGAPVKVVATLTFNFDLGARNQPQVQTRQESPEITRHIQDVEANPRSEAAVLKLGKAYYVLARFEDALKQFKAAVSLGPDDPVALYEVGSAYMSLTNYNDAIQALREAVMLKPDYLEALGLLAFAYNRSERYAEAIPVCWQALNLQPRNGDAYHGLGWAYGGLHRFPAAIAAYKNEVEMRPYYAGAHYGLGVMYASIGDFAAATDELGKAVEINPYLAIAHSHLGMVYVATGDKASAQRELAALRPLDVELAWQLETAIRKSFPAHPK